MYTPYVLMEEDRSFSEWLVYGTVIVSYELSVYLNEKLLDPKEYQSKLLAEHFSDIFVGLFVAFFALRISTWKILLVPGIIVFTILLVFLDTVPMLQFSISGGHWDSARGAITIGLIIVYVLFLIYYLSGSAGRRLVAFSFPVAFCFLTILCVIDDNCYFHLHHASISILMLWASQMRRSKAAALIRGSFFGIYINALASWDTSVILALLQPW